MSGYELQRCVKPRALRPPSALLHSSSSFRGVQSRKPPTSVLVARSTGSSGTVVIEQAVEAPTNITVDHEGKSQRPLRLAVGTCYLPHPGKVSYGGEDAHFVSESTQALGVADGVGGWQESGINPAEYSRTLMAVAHAHLEGRDVLDHIPPRILNSARVQAYTQQPASPPAPGHADPQGALDVAHRLTRVPGSSTACVMQIEADTNTLVAANVGDSGFMLVRNGERLLMSNPMEHFFDCPLQLGAYPEYVEATDTAADAEIYRVQLEYGDVLIAGTDGLWDNCYQGELVALAPKDAEGVAASARSMALLARGHAEDSEFRSPYVKDALQNGYDLPWWEKVLGAGWRDGSLRLKELSGGKQDDITVLVAYITDEPPPPAPAAEIPEAQIASQSSNGLAAAAAVTVVIPEQAPIPVPEFEPVSSSNGNGVAAVVSTAEVMEERVPKVDVSPYPKHEAGSAPRAKVRGGEVDVEIPDDMTIEFCISMSVDEDEEA